MMSFLQSIWSRFASDAPGFLSFNTAVVSDCGLVRRDNQDSYVNDWVHGLLCVCDGMGGGEGGALASQWVCEALQKECVKEPALSLPQRENQLTLSLAKMNDRIRAHAFQCGYKMMGTTLAAFLPDLETGLRARIAHVGDSRIYRWRVGRLDLLTHDHTVGNELGSAVAYTDAQQAKSILSRRNPLTHVLTRAIGVGALVRPDWRTVDVLRGDRLLICSDGVHDMLSDHIIGEILKHAPSPRTAVQRLEEAVRLAGACDNYTILCAYAVRGKMRHGKTL